MEEEEEEVQNNKFWKEITVLFNSECFNLCGKDSRKCKSEPVGTMWRREKFLAST